MKGGKSIPDKRNRVGKIELQMLVHGKEVVLSLKPQKKK